MVRHGSAKPSFVGSNPITALVSTYTTYCRCGGIGRRAGLKILCPHGRVGSTPTIGISEAVSQSSEELLFLLFRVRFKKLSVGEEIFADALFLTMILPR